ncbi:MAG: serine hydrolase domain-containing protein [Pseudomonadota bacterium]
MRLRSLALQVMAALALGAPAAAAAESVTVSATVLGHAKAYVAAVNGDGDAGIKAFHEGHSTREIVEAVPFEAVAGYFRHQHRVLGGVELIEVRMSGPDTAVALMRNRVYGALFAVTFNLDPAQDDGVIEFDPGPAPDWAPRDGSALAPADLGERARALADRGCRAEVFSGAWLVAKGPDVLAEGACGLANRRYDAPNRVDTRINLGSINKMFTAVAVMQLVEAGKVSLDDTLDRYLDDSWLPTDVSRTIRIRHLLTHSSGLDSPLGAEFRKSSPTLFRTLADYRPLIHDETPAFEPGSGYLYSNTGMLLLGAVIEKVSGEDYYAYVRGHIFKPLGMSDTESWPFEDPAPNLAMGYYHAPDAPFGWRENTQRQLYRGIPAGLGYSTVGDLHRFALGMLNDRLISAASRDWMWTRNLPNEYGAGFMITGSQAGRIVGHEGFFAGVSSQLEIYVDKGYVVVILGNQDWAAPSLGDAFRGLVASAR